MIRRTLGPYAADDPRQTPTAPEKLRVYKSVTCADVKKLYDEFLGPRESCRSPATSTSTRPSQP